MRSRQRLVGTVVAAASAMIWAPLCAAGGASDKAVLAEIESYYKDLSARDWDAFAAHFWPGATIATVWKSPGAGAESVMVATVPQFVAQAAQGPGSKPIFEEWMTSSRVEVTGGLAQVWAGYSARFGEEGDLVEWSGVDAFTLLNHGGRWRITSIAFAATDDAAAGKEGEAEMSEGLDMTPGTVGWRDLTVPNAEEVRDFYERVAGWESQPVHMGEYSDFSMIAPAKGHPVAGICHARGVNANLPPQWLMYIIVEDIEDSMKACAEMGGEVVVPLRKMGEAKFCVIKDPAGAVCALFQP